MDGYGIHLVMLLFIVTFETVSVAWVYGETPVDGFNEDLRVISVKLSLAMTRISTHPTGADRFYRNIEDMLGYQVFPVLKYCWLFITPIVCVVRFVFICIQSQSLQRCPNPGADDDFSTFLVLQLRCRLNSIHLLKIMIQGKKVSPTGFHLELTVDDIYLLFFFFT